MGPRPTLAEAGESVGVCLIWIRVFDLIRLFNVLVFTNQGWDMKANVGGIDRILRITVGTVLLALALTGAIGPWGWLGVLPLLTGLVGWCPPYALFGWNTCPTKS